MRGVDWTSMVVIACRGRIEGGVLVFGELRGLSDFTDPSAVVALGDDDPRSQAAHEPHFA